MSGEDAPRRRGAPATFLTKLSSMLSEEDPAVVSWNESGTGFEVKDMKTFLVVLRERFNHKNYGSFQRQLNLYQFKKDGNTYAHEHFRRDSPEDMVNIIRVQPRKPKIKKSASFKSLVADIGGSLMRRVRSPPFGRDKYEASTPGGTETVSEAFPLGMGGGLLSSTLEDSKGSPPSLYSSGQYTDRNYTCVDESLGGASEILNLEDLGSLRELLKSTASSFRGSEGHEVVMDVTRQMSENHSGRRLAELLQKHVGTGYDQEEPQSGDETRRGDSPPPVRGLGNYYRSVSFMPRDTRANTGSFRPQEQGEDNDILGAPPDAAAQLGDIQFGSMSRLVLGLSSMHGHSDEIAGSLPSVTDLESLAIPSLSEVERQASLRGLKRGLSEKVHSPVEVIDKHILDSNDISSNAIHVFIDNPAHHKRRALDAADAGETYVASGDMEISNVAFAPLRNALFVTLTSSERGSNGDLVAGGIGNHSSNILSSHTSAGSDLAREDFGEEDANFLSRLMKIPLENIDGSDFTTAFDEDDEGDSDDNDNDLLTSIPKLDF